MYIDLTCYPRWYVRSCPCGSRILLLGALFFFAAGVSEAISSARRAQQSREPGPQLRLPRQQAQTNAALDGVVRSDSPASTQTPAAGALLELRNLGSGALAQIFTNGEGVDRKSVV